VLDVLRIDDQEVRTQLGRIVRMLGGLTARMKAR
jgi:hypothetical protein